MIRWHGEYSTMPFSHVRESRKSCEAWEERQPGSWSHEPMAVTCSLLRTHPQSADDAYSLLPCSCLISGWLHDTGTLTRRLEMCSWRSWLYLGRNRQLGLGEIGWQVPHETVKKSPKMALHQKDSSGYESIPVMTNFLAPKTSKTFFISHICIEDS